MVDKVFEIIEYFNPAFWWIENPQTSKMKYYINELIPFYDFDYCKYSDYGYRKRTRFWTNIEGFKPLICKYDCENTITIKTQKGAVHTGYKTLIKGETRTLHKNPIGDVNKAQPKDQKIHNDKLGGGEYIMLNGKIKRINTAELRKKYKDYPKIKKGNILKKETNILERYRIPEKLIEELIIHI